MNTYYKKVTKPLALLALLGLLTACGSSSTSAGSSAAGDDDNTTAQDDCTGLGCGVFDEGQQIVSDVIGGTLASALPEPLSSVVSCGAEVVVDLMEVPDSFIAGLSSVATSQDPSALLNVATSSAGAFSDVVDGLYGMFSAITGQNVSCADGGDGSTGIGSGSPLDVFLGPIVGSLGMFTGGSALDESGPAGALIGPVRLAAEAILGIIAGGSPLDFDLSMFDLAGGGNNMLDYLQELQSLLTAATSGGGSDLGDLAGISGAIQQAMAAALSQGGSALQDGAGSEIPVIGGLLNVIQGGLLGNLDIMNAIGNQDLGLINSGAESLLENNLLGVFTDILPLGSIGDQAGVDVIGLIQQGIEQGVSQLGGGTGLSLDSLFDVFSGGASGSSTNPAEQFISGLLASSPIGFEGLLGGGLGQLFESIGQLVPSADDLAGSNVGPLDGLLGGLTAVDSGIGSGTPFDLVLGSLSENDPVGVFGDLLGGLEDTVETLFGAFTGFFNRS